MEAEVVWYRTKIEKYIDNMRRSGQKGKPSVKNLFRPLQNTCIKVTYGDPCRPFCQTAKLNLLLSASSSFPSLA